MQTGWFCTPIQNLYSYGQPNGVVILELLIKNGVSILDMFPGTGCNILSVGKLQFCKQPFEIIQGEITFKNTVRCVNKYNVVPVLRIVSLTCLRAWFCAF